MDDVFHMFSCVPTPTTPLVAPDKSNEFDAAA